MLSAVIRSGYFLSISSTASFACVSSAIWASNKVARSSLVRAFSSTAFAGTSWAADNNRDLHGEVILEDAVPGIEGDGSIELMQAFCNSVISGEQPKDVLEEGYYGSILCLMGDDAILQERTVKMEKDWII